MVDEIGILGHLGVGAAVLQVACASLQSLEDTDDIILDPPTNGVVILSCTSKLEKSYVCTYVRTYGRTSPNTACQSKYITQMHTCTERERERL